MHQARDTVTALVCLKTVLATLFHKPASSNAGSHLLPKILSIKTVYT